MAIKNDGTVRSSGKTDSERNSKNVNRRLGGFGAKSEVDGNESHEILHADCTWRNRRGENCNQGQEPVGKILGQLRELQAAHLAYCEAHQKQVEIIESEILELLDQENTVE